MINITHILAFCTPLILFAFWTVIGYSALSLLRTQRNTMQNILMAPTAGIALTLLPVFWLSRAGWPVQTFATPLTAILFALSTIILLWKRPLFPIKYYLAFAGVFLLALWLTGRPLFYLGFNWLSYGNDDMANYCLGALRFLHHGYSDAPVISKLIAQQDVSQHYWFLHIASMSRAGAELLLAWSSAITHLTTLQIFMPLILGFHLSLISATSALIYKNRSLRNIAILTGLLLTCSPLNSLGTLYQLIAQVMGIGLLITAVILLMQPFSLYHKYNAIKQSLLISIILSALLISYPEVAPFLFLSASIYFIISLFYGWRPTRQFTLIVIFCSFGLILSLNTYWKNILFFLQHQANTGMSTANAETFPYFLLPTGLPNFMGLLPIAGYTKEPWQSLVIFLALIFLIYTTTEAIKYLYTRRFQQIFINFLIMLIFCLILFTRSSGFGLFKLTMYIQPFLMAVIAIILFSFNNKKIKYLFIFFVIILLNTQYKYLKNSYSNLGDSFSELSHSSNLSDELNQLTQSVKKGEALILDVHNRVSAKLLGLHLTNNKTYFYSNNFFKFSPSSNKTAKKYADIVADQFIPLKFTLNNTSFLSNPFEIPKEPELANKAILSTSNRTILNFRKFEQKIDKNYLITSIDKIFNYLIFINSDLGEDYYGAKQKNTSLRNFEKDYFYQNRGVSGLGQYFLFQILNPSPKVRLEINITKTNSQDRDDPLPHPFIIGSSQKPFSVVGKGSAHVFSPPIEPQIIDKRSYIMLDFRETGKPHHGERKGLMKLYGTHINLDIRPIIAYGRNISLISDDQYQSLLPPISISHFPEDLKNIDLEYSGLYEDGWTSDAFFVTLTQKSRHNNLVIKGYIPMIDKPIHSEISLFIDDQKMATKLATAGEFYFKVYSGKSTGRRKIEMHFSKLQNLPNDGRSIGAKINFIGFEGA